VKKIFRKKTIRTKIIGIVFLSIFLITLTLGYLSFHFSKRRLIVMLGDSSKSVATTIANFMNGDDIILIENNLEGINEKYFSGQRPALAYHENVSGEKSFRNEAVDLAAEKYTTYVSLLANVKEANGIESPINIYVRDKNRLRLILTSENTMAGGALYSMRPEALKALSKHIPQATGIYKDKDGTWISAFAPISFSFSTATSAIVEVNNKVDLYMNKLREELGMIILLCLAGFFVTAVIGYQLVDRLVETIKKVDDVARELEKENYNVKIKIKSHDEIGHLAQTFEKLRLSIRKKMDELKHSLLKEKKAHLESIIALTNAIELRDPYTRRHLYRVDKYALLIAKAMRLGRSDIEKLRYGCYIHDIGKIYIEDALLQKVQLSESDSITIKKHAEDGAKIIEGIPFLREAKEIILYHQERYDGKGYPKGLKGNDIPLLARIVAVADAFDAMTTDRPYKAKISFREAFEIIEKEAGTQFDPEVCAAFLKYRSRLEKISKKHFKF